MTDVIFFIILHHVSDDGIDFMFIIN